MRRITSGLASEPVAQCSVWLPTSMTSAFSLSSSTVARRTVQTLIGSYVALSTSTRPPDQRPRPSASGPCRGWSPSGTDPSGPGGTAVAILRASVAYGGRLRERPEHAHGLGVGAQRLDRLGDRGRRRRGRRGRRRTCRAEALAARPRLDARQVDAAEGELRQAAHEPARRGRRRRPRTAARSSTRCPPPGRAPSRRDPHEARLVPGRVLDVRLEHLAAVELGGGAAADRGPRRLVAGSRSATSRTASAVEAARTTAAPGSRRADEARALGAAPAGARRPRRCARAARRSRAIRQWRIGWTTSPMICTSAVAQRERVERRVDRALERVLDRHQRALHAALADRRDRVVDGRERRPARASAPPPASSASWL